MARAVADSTKNHPAAVIVQRFIGATPNSSDGRTLLESLCKEIVEHYVENEQSVPPEYQVASGSEDTTVRLWDAESGAELCCLQGHRGPVTCVSFSPDGGRIASASWDRTVRVWDAASGKEFCCLRGHEGAVECVAFSPGGDRVVSGSWDKTMRVWDAQGGTELAVLRGYRVAEVAFSPDGDRIVTTSNWSTGGAPSAATLWDTMNGVVLAVLEPVDSFAFSPTGDRIVTGSRDKTVIVETQIRLTRENSGKVVFRGQYAAVTELDARDVDVLGRDITGLFTVIVDQPGDVVCMLGQRHHYTIQHD